MGQRIPLVCQDWANTKAAYRFFSNDRVSEADILAGHFQLTSDRAAAEAIGITKSINGGRDKAGRLRSHTVCGILIHSSLAVTIEGVPLGLAAVKFWTRKTFEGTAALKMKINRPGFPSRERKAFGGWKISSSLATLGSSGTMHPYC
ncbi:Transposase DNA-binding [Bradyrhizobium yuanmingense]|uniref:Transposase DNA-binding n=1 Tax=Bradyrhizobium yuanmingense TaxID=108015 RepID=A0A1C3XKN5_9BRAD|nr:MULTISPECIES: transposase DNA-binding-containing protein [Bradyrhizobium]TWI17115.1 transposase-like DNA-binding protein [Bradyrhizobium yuanmingense]SCB52695.1 Transposase DNA-binding [Bradyrhizobium yuanmingense]